MRYLITGNHSEGRSIVGYDGAGDLCEVQVFDMPNERAREWVFRSAPMREEALRERIRATRLKVTVLDVTFDEFWKKYAYKEGKKEAQRAWDRMTIAARQLAYDHIDRYRNACMRDRKNLLYPATYLRAERWLDHL